MNNTKESATFVATVDGVAYDNVSECLTLVFEGTLDPSRVDISLNVANSLNTST